MNDANIMIDSHESLNDLIFNWNKMQQNKELKTMMMSLSEKKRMHKLDIKANFLIWISFSC